MRISREQEKKLAELAMNYITRVLEKSLKDEEPTVSMREQLEMAIYLFRELKTAENEIRNLP